jgi:putative N-acetylmannosamine-6-phosphate epimerase
MKRDLTGFLAKVRRGLIVSCQASEGDAFRDSGSMAKFARSAVEAGEQVAIVEVMKLMNSARK